MILYEKYGCSYDLFKRFSVFHDFFNEHFIIVFFDFLKFFLFFHDCDD